MPEPKISIIIPCYNAEKYIQRCVSSVINQSLKDIEIICVNDGSKDGTLDILHSFKKSDDRVRLIDLENGGYGRAVNNGIAIASGTYIGIVESDDYINENMYETLYGLSFNGTVDLIKGNFFDHYERVENSSGSLVKAERFIVNTERLKMPAVKTPFTIRQHPELFWGHPSVWSAIYKLNFLRDNDITFIEAKGGGWVDNPFFFDTLCNAKSIMWTNVPLYNYTKTNLESSSNRQTDPTLPFIRMMDNLDVLQRNGYTDTVTRKYAYARALMYLSGARKECDYDNNFNIIDSYAKKLMQKAEPDIFVKNFNAVDQFNYFTHASPLKSYSASFQRVLIYNWLPFDNSLNWGGGVNLYCRNLVNTIIKECPGTIVYFLSSGFTYDVTTTEVSIRKIENIFDGRCHSFEIVNSPVPAAQQFLIKNPLIALENIEIKDLFKRFLDNHGPFKSIHFNNIEGLSLDVLDLKQDFPETRFIYSMHNYVPLCLSGYYFDRQKVHNCNPSHTAEDCYNCTRINAEKNLAGAIYNRGLLDLKNKKALPRDMWINSLKLNRLDECITADKMLDFQNTAKIKINSNCDHILAVSKRVHEIAVANGLDKDKLSVVYIGTEVAKEQIHRDFKLPSGSLKIIFLGADLNHTEKGYSFLLDALEALDAIYARKIDLVLTLRNKKYGIVYEKLKNFRSVKVVKGYTHNDLRKLLEDCDLGIVPVVWEDNLPQITIEMAAYGVPVLASSLGGASELCRSDLFKFEGGNAKDFNDKIIHFLNKPEDLNEYWKYYTGIKTMSEHWDELSDYYGLEDDMPTMEFSKQDYSFLIMENEFLRKQFYRAVKAEKYMRSFSTRVYLKILAVPKKIYRILKKIVIRLWK